MCAAITVVGLVALPPTADAGLARGLCRSDVSRGTIPHSFAVKACFDGHNLFVYNDLDLALGVATSGSVGKPRRTESNFELAVDAARLKSKDPGVLLPGDTLKFPIGPDQATIKLRGTSTTSFYFLASAFAHFFPIPRVGNALQTFTAFISELDAAGHKYLDCEQSGSKVHRLACKAILARDVSFAIARFIVNGALAIAKSNRAKLFSAVLGLVEGARWAYSQPGQLKAVLHSGTIFLASTIKGTVVTRLNPVTASSDISPGYTVTSTFPTGKCEEGSDLVAQAYRCFADQEGVYDPCYAVAEPGTGDGTGVVCLTSPFSQSLVAITSATGLGMLYPEPADVPYGLVLGSGNRCTALEGAHGAATNGRVIDYGCDDQKTTVLRGLHTSGSGWTADIGHVQGDGSVVPAGSQSISTAVMLEHDVPPANRPVTDAGNATPAEFDVYSREHHEVDCGLQLTRASSSFHEQIYESGTMCSEADLVVTEWDNGDALEPGWSCVFDAASTLLCQQGAQVSDGDAPTFFSSPHIRALAVG